MATKTSKPAGVKMRAVKSSNVAQVGYTAKTKTLSVKFHSGSYQFLGVPAAEHRAMVKADSVGGYFHDHIKGKYEFQKLDDAEQAK